jgi:cyanophycinase-like exopeptidase
MLAMPGETPPKLKPLYLFADSQLLFWKRDERRLLESVIEGLPEDSPGAAYVGASNGDRREFYTIFEAAMDTVGLSDRRMISAAFDTPDRTFLERAQLILLAGGDVRLGWDAFEKTGMKEVILSRYAQGAVLIGISAGAVQLGRHAILETPQSCASELVNMLNLAPAVVDVHDEQGEWGRLSSAVHLLEGTVTGLGIPTGGGVMVHPDTTFEPLRHPAHEFVFDGTHVTHSLLFPSNQGAV